MSEHYSVMLKETIELLNINPKGVYVDGTLGRGGHSKSILNKLTTGSMICFDKDEDAINLSKDILVDYKEKIKFIHEDFIKAKEILNNEQIYEIDGFLLDLGVSSPQFDKGERGFSYRFDSRLDMRMDKRQKLTAYEVVNNYTFNQLVVMLLKYGEERNAKLIARGIEKQRLLKPIETTFELVDVIKKSLPNKVLSKKGHPAKQTFQAIRIEVNDELDCLDESILNLCSLLKVGGRGVIITFHSLEDRIVKNVFNKLSTAPFVNSKIPLLPSQMEQADYRVINKKPLTASKEELEVNNRSHSAKLRCIEKIRG
ncbi:MAG: 16S rRNA (cytosine(1402)-N(4))-methyltransferase RsmH [Erysipelotrichaceae bacterium]|nr:16S rRNA (cytosine(1402)-N(4))-methyltransferase RsmH [Erysipelotrichaceae bacterium]